MDEHSFAETLIGDGIDHSRGFDVQQRKAHRLSSARLLEDFDVVLLQLEVEFEMTKSGKSGEVEIRFGVRNEAFANFVSRQLHDFARNRRAFGVVVFDVRKGAE